MPFDVDSMWRALRSLTSGPADVPVTADEVAHQVRSAHPRTAGARIVTHNDLIACRRILDQLILDGVASSGADRPAITGRWPRTYLANQPPATTSGDAP
ncbi:MAG: hypothetical protein HEQ38_05040 [Gemmatimonas sp.]|nr:hypothetical protein [Gemmatimonas sp.]